MTDAAAAGAARPGSDLSDRLRPIADGTRSTVTGEAEVDAPVVGRQAEAAVRELAMVVLRREDDVLRRWLGSPD